MFFSNVFFPVFCAFSVDFCRFWGVQMRFGIDFLAYFGEAFFECGAALILDPHQEAGNVKNSNFPLEKQ